MSTAVLEDDDYIIGANNQEIERLGLQHTVWREDALSAFRRAGIKPGMTVIDIGSGPGYAAFDLARLVGRTGRVIAVDQSRLFLEALEQGAHHRNIGNIEVVESDLADLDWDGFDCDVAWSRWCLSFVPDPASVMAGIDRALRPGGIFLAQEYADYDSLQMIPDSPAFLKFVKAVERSWRHFDGDPNVGRRFPEFFRDLGWRLHEARPIVHAARPGEAFWDWPVSWFEQAPARMVELGFLTPEEAREFEAFVEKRKADPASMMITPMVLEAIACKPG